MQQDRHQEPRGVGRLAPEQRIQQDGRDGLPVRAFLQCRQDVPQRDPLLTEEAAAGVAVHAQVDLAVRHAADVVGQLLELPDSVSQVPVDRTRIVSSSSSDLVMIVSLRLVERLSKWICGR